VVRGKKRTREKVLNGGGGGGGGKKRGWKVGEGGGFGGVQSWWGRSKGTTPAEGGHSCREEKGKKGKKESMAHQLKRHQGKPYGGWEKGDVIESRLGEEKKSNLRWKGDVGRTKAFRGC